jgi:hypothetical protein
MEPTSNNRAEKCVPKGDGNSGKIAFSVQNQWPGGFCGTLKTKCNGPITVIIPDKVQVYTIWSLSNSRQVGASITGSCPSWAGTGVFEAGFCASNVPANTFIVSTSEGFGTSTMRTNEAGTVLQAISRDVSISIAVPGTKADERFVTAATTELSFALGLGGSQVSLQSATVSDGMIYASFLVKCENDAQTNDALTFTTSNLAGEPVDPSDIYITPQYEIPSPPSADSNPAPIAPWLIAVSAVGGLIALIIFFGGIYYIGTRGRRSKAKDTQLSKV